MKRASAQILQLSGANYTAGFHFSPADILVAQAWSSRLACALLQLTIQEFFRNVAGFHSLTLTKPAEESLAKNGKHAGHVGWRFQ